MLGQLIHGDPETLFEGAAIDSRKVEGGELFFALQGKQTDGHVFVEAALQAGARAAVVEDGSRYAPGAALIQVEDPYRALHALTRHLRSSVPRRLVGVTGSAGKTTTKELLASMLATRFRTRASPGNLNNLYGFPLALLNLPEDTEWMVAEMGMSEPGELAQISRLGRPDVVVLTNVGPVHLSSFDSLRAIAAAKAEILAGLSVTGTVVLNAGDPELARMGERLRLERPECTVLWFGLGDPPPEEHFLVRARNLQLAPRGTAGSDFELEAGGESAPVKLSLAGPHNVENCLAAATVAFAMDCSLQRIAEVASSMEPVPMRGVLYSLDCGARLWDDSYNSNPAALSQTLSAAARVASRRRWAILGDMLELGAAAALYHRQAGREAARLGFDPVVGVGEMAKELVEAAQKEGARGEWFEDAAAAAEFASRELSEGDLLLVKGSRGLALDEIVALLRTSS